MVHIQSNYLITERTMAMQPAYALDYDTIVIERDRTRYIRKTPLELLKRACLTYGSSYDGRRDSVIHQTGIQRRVPIPVSVLHKIYTFPTLSPHNFDCMWIFNHHVLNIEEAKTSTKQNRKTTITFTNHEQITINLPLQNIQNQIQRTIHCWQIYSASQPITIE